MATMFYATVTGAKQGAFKDESPSADFKGKIPGVDFSYGVESPREPATGLPTGKRQHHPVIFTKLWGASSPQFYDAAFNAVAGGNAGNALSQVLAWNRPLRRHASLVPKFQ
jgi:type VI secretion system secreted protein Hcp